MAYQYCSLSAFPLSLLCQDSLSCALSTIIWWILPPYKYFNYYYYYYPSLVILMHKMSNGSGFFYTNFKKI